MRRPGVGMAFFIFRLLKEMAPQHHITVFEAANSDLKEIYVVWTARSVFEAMGALDKRPPAAIAHWRPSKQRIDFRSLEFKLNEDEARAFIARHATKQLQSGWKYIIGSRV